MENTVELEILGLSSNHSQSGSFTLILGEIEGKRRLPIVIGMFEAQAIAIEIEKIIPNRPMTHDLFKSFSSNFGFSIEHILVSDMREGVFYAKIVCHNATKRVEIDARPSDAIAIGLRFNVPIYTYEAVLSEAGIVLTDETEDEPEEVQKETTRSEKKRDKPLVEQLKDLPTDKLQTMLNEALAKEEYEKAAKIRDEINRRN